MRRKLDQYFSPQWAVKVLLREVPHIGGSILEPCSGHDDLAGPLRAVGIVTTNDIDPAMPSDTHCDATKAPFWESTGPYSWIVSNPPFNVCQQIIEHASRTYSEGMAMLLRLSYLEPCKDRASFLAANPPDQMIVLPRISFTGDGKTDTVTCAWFVWDRYEVPVRPIVIVPKGQV